MADGNGERTVTWRELLEEAASRLEGAVASPRVDARRIVEEASGYEGAELHDALAIEATELGVARFDRMLARRLAGEPLQYVLGRWAFRSLDLFVDARVLIPRPETEVVAGLAIDELDRVAAARPGDEPLLVADLGTGSGAIGLAVAKERDRTQVWLVDRSPGAVAVARANLAGLGRPGTRVTVLEGSWFEPLPAELRGRLDVVVSNPPYVGAGEELPAEVSEWEPAEALVPGPTGMEAIELIVVQAVEWLRPGGALVVEHAPHQAGPVVELALRAGFVAAAVHPDLAGRDRALVARR